MVDAVDPDSGMGAMEQMSLAFGASTDYASKTDELMGKVTALQEALASGEMVDVTIQIALVLGLMVEIGGDIVQDDADSMTATDKYMSVAAEMQSILATQDGSPVQDINIYTGIPVTDGGNRVEVPPEEALANAATYLLNNPSTKYNLDSNGQAVQATDEDGVLLYNDDGTPMYEENPIYDFFQKNKELAASTTSNVKSVINSLQDDTAGSFTIGTETPGYTIDPATGAVTGKGVTIDSTGAVSNITTTTAAATAPQVTVLNIPNNLGGTYLNLHGGSYTKESLGTALGDQSSADAMWEVYQTSNPEYFQTGDYKIETKNVEIMTIGEYNINVTSQFRGKSFSKEEYIATMGASGMSSEDAASAWDSIKSSQSWMFSTHSKPVAVANPPVAPSSTTTGSDGLIKNMWTSADTVLADDGSTYITGDSSMLNQAQSAMSSLNQSLTSNSSAIQSLAQTDAQTLNAQETTLNKFLQAMISQMKTMVQSQKSG